MAFKTENEKLIKKWTFESILVRILLYPLAVFLIGLGVYIVLSDFDFISLSIGTILVCTITRIILFDVRIMFGK